jgi:hypothetical protein
MKEFKTFFYEWIDFKYEIFCTPYFYRDDLACDLDLDLLDIFLIYLILSFGFDWADNAEIVFKVDFLF